MSGRIMQTQLSDAAFRRATSLAAEFHEPYAIFRDSGRASHFYVLPDAIPNPDTTINAHAGNCTGLLSPTFGLLRPVAVVDPDGTVRS